MRGIILIYPYRVVLVALALLATVGLHGTALAHAQVVSVEPAAGSQLAESPGRVRVVFNEPIAALSSLQLLDARGQAVVQPGGPSPDDPAVLEVTTPELSPGVYTAVWSIIGSDGHVVKGNFAFTILGGALTDTPIQPELLDKPVPSTSEALTNHTPPSPLAIVLRGAMLLGSVGAVGGWIFMIALLLPALAAQSLAPDPVVVRHWRRWTTTLLALVIGAAALMLVVYSQEIAGRLNFTLIPIVIRDTRYGLLLTARVVLAAVLLLQLNPRGHAAPPAGWQGAIEFAPFGGILLLTFSLAGHPSAQAAPLLPVFADWLHLSATVIWLGGLGLFALLLPAQMRSMPDGERPPLLARLFTRFSSLALISVAVLTATGVYAALREIGALSDLWQSSYGLALLAKLIVFGGLLGFGAYHLLVARPRLSAWAIRLAEAAQTAHWQRRVGVTLRAEAGLALLAILAAGALTSLPPPAEPALETREANIAPSYRRVNEMMAAGDLYIGIDIDPTRIGNNTFTVTVRDDSGRSMNTVQLVRLSFERPDLDIGVTELEATQESADTYAVSGSALSVLGDWQVRVLVRRSDADDVETTFTVPVAE